MNGEKKMKATELMIGDWVSQSNGNAVKIDWLKTGEYGYYDKYGKMKIACTPLLEPITLTPEILEKNGFTRYGQVYANLQQWVCKFGDKRKSFVQDIRTGEWGMNNVWINYVHELQHALRLCGLNDLADNFKL